MKNYKKFGNCEVCKAECKTGEDVVVCPKCGTPYHRNCYESVGRCVHEEEHSQGFLYKVPDIKPDLKNNDEELGNETEINNDGTKKCPYCFNENPSNSFFCDICGYSFYAEDETDKEEFSPLNNIPIPLPLKPVLKMDKNESINDIKIFELTNFIKINIVYYLSVFQNIVVKNKSRFNFSAFLFSGAWFLYRKLYKVGVTLTLTMLLLSVFSTFISFTYVKDILNSIGISYLDEIFLDKYDLFVSKFYELPDFQKFIIFLPTIIQIINFVIMLVSGFVANRVYYKNCCSKIKKIKVICKDDKKLYQKEINKFGGINFKVVPFITICYIIIEYLPRFLI